MDTYSIKDLEKVSGIKAHTIRMWEQRYGIFKPQRTQTNIRLYDDEDLKLLLNISLLCGNGFRISKIAGMNPEQISHEVEKIGSVSEENQLQLNSMMLATLQLDEEKFNKVFANCTLRLGFERTITQVVYPVFEKIGIAWQTGTVGVAQEHFFSNLVRQKLISALDAIEISATHDGYKFLLFLPEGEFHEIALLFASYLIKSRGHKVIYLGQNVPTKDLLAIGQFHQPTHFFTIITSRYGKGCPDEFLCQMSESFPSSVFLFSGHAYENCCECPTNAIHIRRPADLIQLLEKE